MPDRAPHTLRLCWRMLCLSLWLGAAISGCTFDPIEVDFAPAGPPDAPPGADGMRADGGDTPPLDQDLPPEDMSPDIADMPMPGVDLDAPDADVAEMGDLGGDMPPDARMPDMPDLPAPQDMGTGRLGESCQADVDCVEGRCEFFGARGACTTECATSCPADSGLVCVLGLCTPSDYCGASGQDPGCATCDKCAVGSDCVELIGPMGERQFSCACRTGYTGDGYTCADVDECADPMLNDCAADATCANTAGSFECTCDPGFEGDGVTCTPAQDPCAACSSNAACLDVGGMRSCKCNPGYTGDGFNCVDIDECQTMQDDCDTDATCTNTAGSFECTCRTGYTGDGESCTDVDECADPMLNDCDTDATCTNTAGSFECDCNTGFGGDGRTCQAYTSCAQIKQDQPASADGLYEVSTPAGPLTVFCDMTSDGGRGYTLVRFDENTLGGSQAAYAAQCATWGMEIVTPRSQEHLEAIIAWNGGPPNIVNVTPQADGAAGLADWEGQCQGASCSFFVTDRDSSVCRTLTGSGTPLDPYRWSNGGTALSCESYRKITAGTLSSGIYRVDVDGVDPIAPFDVFCEMTLDGGGWTHTVTSSDDGQSTWTWNRRNLWTTNTTTFGDAGLSNRDYKNIALHALDYRDLLFIHSPSTTWASYDDVGDGTAPLATTIAQTDSPNCDTASGYPQSNGTLSAAQNGLCSTDLYFNLGDRDGDDFRCSTINQSGLGLSDDTTYGPSWSITVNQSCPFDDPAEASFGPDSWNPDTESDAMGFGQALGLNLGPADVGVNFIQLFVRELVADQPDGDNLTSERLILESPATGAAGPSCPFGSWNDLGDAVLLQGWVVCSTND